MHKRQIQRRLLGGRQKAGERYDSLTLAAETLVLIGSTWMESLAKSSSVMFYDVYATNDEEAVVRQRRLEQLQRCGQATDSYMRLEIMIRPRSHLLAF